MTFTRRQFSLQIASGIGLSGIALAAPQKPDNEISHTADSIHQEVNFSAERKRIYATLLDTKQFDDMTRLIPSMQTANLGNSPTEISRELGGPSRSFAATSSGATLNSFPTKELFRPGAWWTGTPACTQSSNLNLTSQGSGTKLVFDHTGFPVGLAKHLADGWKEHYWEPLQKYLT